MKKALFILILVLLIIIIAIVLSNLPFDIASNNNVTSTSTKKEKLVLDNQPIDMKAKVIKNENVDDGSHLYNCHNCIIEKPQGKYVVVEGLNDYIVADTGDVLLICSMKNEQQIRDFVSDAKKHDPSTI